MLDNGLTIILRIGRENISEIKLKWFKWIPSKNLGKGIFSWFFNLFGCRKIFKLQKIRNKKCFSKQLIFCIVFCNILPKQVNLLQSKFNKSKPKENLVGKFLWVADMFRARRCEADDVIGNKTGSRQSEDSNT